MILSYASNRHTKWTDYIVSWLVNGVECLKLKKISV